MIDSYRESHKAEGKGRAYHDEFQSLPHRAMLWRLERRLLTRLVSELFGDHRPTHLDFACGTGRILAHLEPRTGAATGVDVSPSMLAVARQEAASAEIIEADLTQQDALGDRQFDLITAFRFFPNAEDELRRNVIEVLSRHLAPRGYLVFNNHLHTASLARRVSRLLGRISKPGDRSKRGPRLMSHDEVNDLVSGAGLRIVDKHPMASLPFTDRHMMWPVWPVEIVERVLSAIPASASIAQNIVYVCQKAD